MKLNAGDKVKFLNEVGTGIITRIEDEKLAYVKIEEGFEIPYMISELLVVEKAASEYSQEEGTNSDDRSDETVDIEDMEQEDEYKDKDKEQIFMITGNDDSNKDDEGDIKIKIALVHANQNDRYNSGINAYLINDSRYHILYNISVEEEDGHQFMEAGILEPDVKVMVAGFSQKQMEHQVKLAIQLLLFRKGRYTYMPPIEESIKLDKSSLVQRLFDLDNEYFNEPAQVLSLFSYSPFKDQMNSLSAEWTEDISKDKGGPVKHIKKSLKHSQDIEEVDLHIHTIMDNYQGLSNGEIINIQMDRFQTALEGAIIHHVKKIVFIHGVGNGKLKYELRKTLENKYHDFKYQDASFREYGYGATMVLLG